MAAPHVVVLDYGSGNVRSAQRALERVGARVEVTAERDRALECDGLVVPGVGAFAACMRGIEDVGGASIIERRLAGGRAVLGICVGMQVLFSSGVEHGETTAGLDQWPGVVERLHAPVLPHMGWDTVEVGEGSSLFRGVENERFYFVHSYGVLSWEWSASISGAQRPPLVSWGDYGGRFISAVENGPLVATQFHPEKSGEAGSVLLRNWVLAL
jgi:imidazole glycerol-phosphate synthase subunit HisH